MNNIILYFILNFYKMIRRYRYGYIPEFTLEYAKQIYSNHKNTLENSKGDYAYGILGSLNMLAFFSENENIKNDVSYQEFKEYVYRKKKIELEPIYSVEHSGNYKCGICSSDGECIMYSINIQYNKIYNNQQNV